MSRRIGGYFSFFFSPALFVLCALFGKGLAEVVFRGIVYQVIDVVCGPMLMFD